MHVFRHLVVCGTCIFDLVMTTVHEFQIYMLALNNTIFEVPMFNGDIYLPDMSTCESRAAISTLYNLKFMAILNKDSDNNMITLLYPLLINPCLD